MIVNVIKFPTWQDLCETTAIGKTAYWSESFLELYETDLESAKKFLLKIIDLEHESVLEHLVFTFNIQQVSRWETHEHIRHRIGSFTQKSLRLVRELTPDDFVVNPDLPKEEIKEAREFFDLALQKYYGAIERGLSPDDARMYIPGSVMSEITWTVNLRALRNFLKLRSKPNAMWEIRLLSRLIANCFVERDMEFLITDVMELGAC